MIFVTGGTGLLGNCIVRELCRRGHETRVLCRQGTSTKPFDDLPVEIVEGDLSDVSVLDRAIEGTQATIHSAAYIHIGWDNLPLSREVNVAGTERIAQACVRHGSRLTHISTVDTLPAALSRETPIVEPDSDKAGILANATHGVAKTPCSYVVSKSEAEAVVQKFVSEQDLDAIILHPGFMLGPYDWKPSSGRMMLEVSKAPLVAAPPGGCSVCDARDVAAGVVNATNLAPKGRHYILAGQNLTYQELWRAMLTVVGSRKHVYRLGPLVKLLGSALDISRMILPIREGDVNGASIRMGYLNHYYSSQRAELELGYQRRPLDETLSDAWDWLSHKDSR
ncbi:MAG: NAD-dependent epimerase/dehydratase family protein [bacterium]|nr:NAD-dependent epimerase/dehydratase family protein [bacterium]